MKRYLPFVIIAAVLVVALGAGFLMFRSSQPQTVPLPNQSPHASPVAVAPKASVTLEEFGDYQCPPCGGLNPELKKLKSEYGNRIKFIFHHFPLSQIHKHALDASRAAAAAGLQGRFWEMHDLLYQNQATWSEANDLRPIVVNFARQLGLNVDRFVRDMDGEQVNSVISNDVILGQSLNVTGTPTLFVDGQMIQMEDSTPDKLRKTIDQRLSGQR